MSRVTVAWAGGEHDFCLTLGGLRAVQDLCNAGPMLVLRTLADGSWRVDTPITVMRHGLIGAGMADTEARDLVLRIAETHPLADLVVPAYRVLAAAMVGVEDDPVGKPSGAAETTPQPTESSASA
jgi:hypothetical protein